MTRRCSSRGTQSCSCPDHHKLKVFRAVFKGKMGFFYGEHWAPLKEQVKFFGCLGLFLMGF